MSFYIHYFLLLLVLRLGLALDQEELDLIGYPVEYDTPNNRIPIAVPAQRTANIEINDENYIIWSKEQLVQNTPNENRKLSEEVIFQMCNEYQLVLKTEQEERIIDCEHLKLIPKSVVEQLERNKRDARDDQFEGSGVQEESTSETTANITENNSATETATVEENTPFIEGIKKEDQKAALKVVPDATRHSPNENDKNEESTMISEIEFPAQTTTIKELKEHESKDEGSGGKKARKMKTEDTNEHQSNISIMETSHEGKFELQDSADKMQQKESIKELPATPVEDSKPPPAHDPKPDQSSKELSKASKDTSILIFLFVAVVVVGVAAFGYNFIKKRRQANHTNDLEAGDKINPIKQSLQSLTKTSTIQEQGQEMKPLITATDAVATNTTTISDHPQNNGTDDKVH